MKEDSHIIFVVCGIEASDIDAAAAHAIAEILSVKRGSAVISDEVFLATYRSNDVSFLYGGGDKTNEGQDHE